MWLGSYVGLTVSSALYSMQDWYWLVVTADYLITEGLHSKKNKVQSAFIGSLFPTTPLHLHVIIKFLHPLCHWECSAGLCTVTSTSSFHWTWSYLSTVVWIGTSIIYLKSMKQNVFFGVCGLRKLSTLFFENLGPLRVFKDKNCRIIL